MALYEVIVETTVEQVYCVEARNWEEAAQKALDGYLTADLVNEAGVMQEVTSIEEVDE